MKIGDWHFKSSDIKLIKDMRSISNVSYAFCVYISGISECVYIEREDGDLITRIEFFISQEMDEVHY